MLHEAFAWVVVISNGLVGAAALGANWLEALQRPALWWALGTAQVTVFIQVILGAVLVAGQGVEVQEFHMFYGFVAIVAIGILYSYRNQLREHQYLLYGLGNLFVMGLCIRAMTISPR